MAEGSGSGKLRGSGSPSARVRVRVRVRVRAYVSEARPHYKTSNLGPRIGPATHFAPSLGDEIKY